MSILNDLLQTDNERDYSGTISGIPIEPLLTIIKSIDSSDVDSSSEKMKARSSKSSDSGHPTSPLVERSSSMKKRSWHDEKETDNTIPKSHSWGRNKTYSKHEHIPGSIDIIGRGRSVEVAGRGRSESFSDSAVSRDVSPLSAGRGSTRNSDSDCKDSPGLHLMSKTRKYSRGSSSSMEVPVNFSKPAQTSVVARHVAMKMLAASSRNAKLQEELAKARILRLLLDCLDDPDEEIVLQATATLANIAMNVETHLQIQVENTEESLFRVIKHSNPRVRYQAARGLIYLGHIDVDDIYIYHYLPDEDSSPTVIYVEEDVRMFVRGTTVENLVLTLTKDVHLLWGGASITPPSPNEKKPNVRNGNSKVRSKTLQPTEHQIINFILGTYQTFIHPIIFMRLLLHCFREPDSYKNFSNLSAECENPHMEHYAPLPVLHARIMRIWIAWLENYPNDFVDYPTMRTELSELIAPMKLIDGPYAPCASRLEILLSKAMEGPVHGSMYRLESESHHNVLYEQCYKAIKDNRLPCSEDDSVYLAGLQLYIEDLCEYGQDFPQRLNTIDSINTTRLKQSIGNVAASSKQMSKKIRSQYEMFLHEQPTERNAKHNYVDCCQGMGGYGCTFFKVKQRIPSNRSRKKIYISRLFGVNAKRIVVLDERSKVCVEKFNSRELRRWEPIEDSLTLKTFYRTKHCEKTLEFQLENRVSFKELSNHILTCTMEINLQGYQNIDTNPWSKLAEEVGTWGNMALQLHVNKTTNECEESPTTESARGRSTTTTVFPGRRLVNILLLSCSAQH